MQLRLVFWALLVLAVILTLLSVPASAQVSGWSFGGVFTVGGTHFRVGFAEAGPYGPSYYFEAGRPLVYPGHACSAYCYHRGGRDYHHPSCARVNQHFRRYGYLQTNLIAYYGPPPPYPPPIHYDYDLRSPRLYPPHGDCCDRHSWKGHRHHLPPGHYKKHYKKHDRHDHDDD
jgi:hypothetical protein